MSKVGEEAEAEPSQSSCPAYVELLEVMDRAMTMLDLPWKRASKVTPRGRLDERYLSDHSPPAQCGSWRRIQDYSRTKEVEEPFVVYLWLP
ncbi:hypothetical protein cypCar_00036360 [Cyprinus carpio]|nr:hypothetical protein cypCar_00036360 [Cyprinus carpio]